MHIIRMNRITTILNIIITITIIIFIQAGKVIELLTANSALLSDHEARERSV